MEATSIFTRLKLLTNLLLSTRQGGQLLLSTAGFEMGAPLMCSGKAGRAPSGKQWDPEIDVDTWATAKTALEIREFKVRSSRETFCVSFFFFFATPKRH